MKSTVTEICTEQTRYFQTGVTRDIQFRKNSLRLLLQNIQQHEKEICKALYQDLRKPEFESLSTEIYMVLKELRYTLKNLNRWTKSQRVRPSWLNFPSTDSLHYQPYGRVLIIAPFNYPFQLAMRPLIGALAAGNTVVLKPSEWCPHTAELLQQIINQTFDSGHVEVVTGPVETAKELLQQPWDYIFFTGSTAVGKLVAHAAAHYLTPVTLELGGKSPCIVDPSASLDIAARRIAFGKLINAGQTCVAPDYILVHRSVKDKLIDALIREIEKFYGKNPQTSPDFSRIINKRHLLRLKELLTHQRVIYGGHLEENDNYLAPTLVDEPQWDSPLMQQEIFGPILPIISYTNEYEIDTLVSKNPTPLALYVFSERKNFVKQIIDRFSFGGATINDTVVHLVNSRLPFGGVGNSGMGQYGGRFSFETFSHKKAVVHRATWCDIKIRYAPYSGKLKQLKLFFRWFT